MKKHVIDAIIILLAIIALLISSIYVSLQLSFSISFIIVGGYLLIFGATGKAKSYVTSAPSYYIMWGGVLIDIAIALLLISLALDIRVIIAVFLSILIPLIMISYKVSEKSKISR